ncbi:hypothetical protein Ancab_002036 [Ancistrocladus abbreviatus]
MEGGESILDAIHDDDNPEDFEDVEMLDVEEAEIIDGPKLQIELGNGNKGNASEADTGTLNENRKRRSKKRKNKKKKGVTGSDVTDINRFVLDVCRQLKEKKSYLVYTAVGCLGVSALSDLVKEVDAIQVCGGQKTSDGRRFRTGGGILWNILKTRDPNAYKEIMKKGKEFEKQFKQPNLGVNKNASQIVAREVPVQVSASESDGSQTILPLQDQSAHSSETKQVPIHSRIRVPVSYDDLLGGDEPEDHLKPT